MPKHLDTCCYCGSEAIRTVWPESGWTQCDSCLLYFRNPMPSEGELEALYRHAWSTPDRARAETGGTDERLASIYARKLAQSLRRTDFYGLRILDVGAGRGAMLKSLIRMGACAVGFEPFGFSYLRSMGFEVYSSLDDIQGLFDGMIMIDVLEHMYRPWDVLRELRERLLDRGGWIYVATGNPAGLNARVKRGGWREAQKQGHLVFPHPVTMERIFQEAGYSKFKRLKWGYPLSLEPTSGRNQHLNADKWFGWRAEVFGMEIGVRGVLV